MEYDFVVAVLYFFFAVIVFKQQKPHVFALNSFVCDILHIIIYVFDLINAADDIVHVYIHVEHVNVYEKWSSAKPKN